MICISVRLDVILKRRSTSKFYGVLSFSCLSSSVLGLQTGMCHHTWLYKYFLNEANVNLILTKNYLLSWFISVNSQISVLPYDFACFGEI